jgi:predicted DNA-binding protein (MmcQ/YjbR family)
MPRVVPWTETEFVSGKPLESLRTICLALPEADERETWEKPNFRVRDKIFAMVWDQDARMVVSCKAPPGSQTILIGADPERFFSPPYVGPKGWVGMWLDDGVDWEEVAFIVNRSYRMTAPKKLAALVPEATDS